jgi:hypothetical protein
MNLNRDKLDASLHGNGPALASVEAVPPLQERLAAEIPAAVNYLCQAIRVAVEDVNARFNAGLEVRQTAGTFEVHEIEKPAALIRVDLTDANDIQYSHFIKRENQMESGTMHVCLGGNGESSIMFPDLPRSPLQVSYREASMRLLNPIF